MFARVKNCVLNAPVQLRNERRRAIGIRQRVLGRECSEVAVMGATVAPRTAP
jgi:hypothetical protein